MIELLKHIAFILIVSQIILFLFESFFHFKSEINSYIFIILCMVIVMLVIKSIPKFDFSLGSIYSKEKYEFTLYDYKDYFEKYKDLIIDNIE